jgi:hypothetical protein
MRLCRYLEKGALRLFYINWQQYSLDIDVSAKLFLSENYYQGTLSHQMI